MTKLLIDTPSDNNYFANRTNARLCVYSQLNNKHMKLFSTLFVILTIFLTSCNNRTTSNPITYNNAVTAIIFSVQLSVDSLEAYLLSTKLRLQEYPDSNFILLNEIDTSSLNNLYKNAIKKTNWGITEINNISFKEKDTIFKPAILKGFELTKKTLSENFKPLIDTLYSCDNVTYKNVVYSMLPQGKESYTNYSAAFDTIMIGQQKFNSQHKYLIDSNLIRFNF